MNIFYRRPLAVSCAFFVLIAFLCFSFSQRAHALVFSVLLLALAVCIIVLLLLRKIGKCGLVCLLCLVAMCLSSLSSYVLFKRPYDRLHREIGNRCTVSGYVAERIDSGAYYSRMGVRLERLNGEPIAAGALLDCQYASALQVGDRFTMEVEPREFENDEYFNEKLYHVSNGHFVILEAESAWARECFDEQKTTLTIAAARRNFHLSTRLYYAIGEEYGGIAVALLMGNRQFLNDADTLHFQRIGISHLLALSGLHVSILIGLFERLLRKLGTPRTARAILIPLLGIGYMLLTGASPSICRAILMLCVAQIAFLWGAEYDAFTALCAALVALLTVTPYAVYDVGLWLSFLAAASIIVFLPAVTGLLERVRERFHLSKLVFKLLSALCTGISVGAVTNLALLPLLAEVFGEASVWSIPATLVLAPFAAVILVLALVSLCLPFTGPVCGAVCGWLSELAAHISPNKYSLIQLRDGYTRVFVFLLLIVLVLYAVCRLRGRYWWIALPLIAAVIVTSSHVAVRYPVQEDWSETVLNAQYGMIHVYTKNGRAVVVNTATGVTPGPSKVKRPVKEALCTEVEAIIFTRFTSRGPLFVADVADAMCVRSVYIPLPTTKDEAARATRIAEEAARRSIDVHFYAGSPVDLPCFS